MSYSVSKLVHPGSSGKLERSIAQYPTSRTSAGLSDYAGQLALAEKYNANERAWSAQQAQKQMDFQERLSSSAHQREVADLQAAGLNPVLSAGGNGASTPTGASGEASSLAAIIPDLIQSMNAKEELSYQKERDKLDADLKKAQQDREYALDQQRLALEQARFDYQREQDENARALVESLGSGAGSGGKGGSGAGSGGSRSSSWSSGQNYTGKYWYIGAAQDLLEGLLGTDLETALHDLGQNTADVVAKIIAAIKNKNDKDVAPNTAKIRTPNDSFWKLVWEMSTTRSDSMKKAILDRYRGHWHPIGDGPAGVTR